MFPTVICFYTEHTAYEARVKKLIASCNAFNLPYSIDSIPNLGSWERNCCYKPKYILRKLSDLQTPVLWIDADAEIVKKPKLFENFPPDIALRIVKHLPNYHQSKMISGTVYFNNTPSAFDILKQWDTECERLLQINRNVWDQMALRNVLLRSNAHIYPLPNSYYMVYDRMKKGEDAFVIHYQLSRIEKRVINREVIPFWEWSP